MMYPFLVYGIAACQYILSRHATCIIHGNTDCIPYHRSILPLIYQTRLQTFQQQRRFYGRRCKILIPPVRVLHLNYTFCRLFGCGCLAYPFGTFYQYRSKGSQPFFQHLICYSWQILHTVPYLCDYAAKVAKRSLTAKQIGIFVAFQSAFLWYFSRRFCDNSIFPSFNFPIFQSSITSDLRSRPEAEIRQVHGRPCHGSHVCRREGRGLRRAVPCGHVRLCLP